MALNWDNVTAVTQNLIIPRLVDNIFNSNPLLLKLYQKGLSEQGGVKILQPLEYGKTSASGSYSGYDLLSTTPNEIITDAEYDWKQNYVSITISGLEERKNSGQNAVVSLLTSKTNNAKRTMQDNMGTQLFTDGTGNGSKDILGLVAAVDDGTNVATYGGIARATYTWWKSDYNNWASTPVSLYAFQQAIGGVTIDADRPDLIVTGQSIYDKLYSVIIPGQRYQSDQMAAAGFQSVQVNGVPVVVDSHCATTNIWLLNTNYLYFVNHQDCNFKFEPFQKPVDQDARVAQILWQGNLCSSNCRMQARCYGVDVTL